MSPGRGNKPRSETSYLCSLIPSVRKRPRYGVGFRCQGQRRRFGGSGFSGGAGASGASPEGVSLLPASRAARLLATMRAESTALVSWKMASACSK